MKYYLRGVIRALAVLLLCCVAAEQVGAQTAPEGNAHPLTRDVSEAGEKLTNPFGEHSTDLKSVPTAVEKEAFAKALDLNALRSLAVFHNGRIKVVQTLADETVRKLTLRRAYVDFVKNEGAPGKPDVRDIKFDTLFTLLDMTIDPAYYINKPLIGVEYLPLRTQLLAAEFPEDAQTQQRWLKVARVTPMMIDHHLRGIADKFANKEPYIRAAGKVDQAVRLFMEQKANFVMVAPATSDQAWLHLSQLDADNPAKRAALALGAAWRKADASAVNAAVTVLAEELPKINASVYPTTSRQLEIAYNRLNAFEWGYWTYFLALVALLVALATGRNFAAITGGGLLAVAVALHATGFILRCLIAERFAIQNQFESMTGLSLFAVIVGAIAMGARRQWLFGAASAAVGFLVLLTATQAGIPGVHIEREAAILNTSVLLKYHVTTVLVSYGLIALGFMCSLFYLGVHYVGGKTATVPFPALVGGAQITAGATGGGSDATLPEVESEVNVLPRAKVLADLDAAQLVLMQLAFWTLGVGILLGAWWADHSWGRWWAFDPKEIWALLTWLVYLVVVHVRIALPARKGITTAWLSVVGFFVMLWTYFGVNLLLPGLHAYA